MEHPISKDEFAKRINFEGYFYDLFTHADIIYQNITVKNRHTFRFFKKKEITDDIYLYPSLYFYEKKKDEPYLVKSAEDHVDIDYIFNKKGKYKLNLFGMINKKGCAQKLLFESYFQCDNDSPKQYKRFPIDEEFAVLLKKKKIFSDQFYKYYKSCDTLFENTIVKNKYTIRLYNNKKVEDISLNLNIFDDQKEDYISINNSTSIKKEKDFTDLELTFNKKGKYLLYVFIKASSSQKNHEYLVHFYFQRNE